MVIGFRVWGEGFRGLGFRGILSLGLLARTPQEPFNRALTALNSGYLGHVIFLLFVLLIG